MGDTDYAIIISVMLVIGGVAAISILVKYKIEKARINGTDISKKTFFHRIITKLFIREHPR